MVCIFPNRGIFHIATIFPNIGEWSNETILHLMQLYATILQLMQLYATHATICNYIATISYATICKYATICNYATMQHETYAT